MTIQSSSSSSLSFSQGPFLASSSNLTLEDCPEELLRNIFSYLSMSDLESLKWASRALHFVALQEIKSREKGSFQWFTIKQSTTLQDHVFTTPKLTNIAKASPMMRKLTIIDHNRIFSMDLQMACAIFKNLRSVTLNGERTYQSKTLEVLGQNNPLLTHLSITHKDLNSYKTVSPIYSIWTHCQQVQSLHIHLPLTEFSSEDLDFLMKKIPKQLRSFTWHTATELLSHDITTIFQAAPHLQKCSLTLSPKTKSVVSKELKKLKLGKFTVKKEIEKPQAPHVHYYSFILKRP